MAKAHTFTDNFNDNSINASKWEAYGSALEVNRRIEIRPDGGIANYAGFIATAAYDLTDSFFHIEVRQALLQSAPTSETSFFARGPGTERIQFSVGGGERTCGETPESCYSSQRYGVGHEE